MPLWESSACSGVVRMIAMLVTAKIMLLVFTKSEKGWNLFEWIPVSSKKYLETLKIRKRLYFISSVKLNGWVKNVN